MSAVSVTNLPPWTQFSLIFSPPWGQAESGPKSPNSRKKKKKKKKKKNRHYWWLSLLRRIRSFIVSFNPIAAFCITHGLAGAALLPEAPRPGSAAPPLQAAALVRWLWGAADRGGSRGGRVSCGNPGVAYPDLQGYWDVPAQESCCVDLSLRRGCRGFAGHTYKEVVDNVHSLRLVCEVPVVHKWKILASFALFEDLFMNQFDRQVHRDWKFDQFTVFATNLRLSVRAFW